ncbi:UNVERIFIED_CONTAM: hypothetical protein Slati_2455100 [Sesamum latifolium]|uniref:Reverse transcriptase domain-containing protein n=1 Tax=Sesamum latifolium TaxID=2727402 RepID=A0AAW2WIC9_9LAMI
MQLFQLGFADDLLLFSKADTASVHVFKRALTAFADLSGLHANVHKSHLILSRSASLLRDTLLAILDFQEGHLPLRYLDFRSWLPDCLLRIVSRSSRKLTDGMDGEIETRLRTLWKGSTAVGYAKVSWQQIFHYRLRDYSIWTISDRSGTSGWHKLIRLRDSLRPFLHYQVGTGTSFSLWHNPWHEGGPLILQFPLGPRHTSIPTSASLCTVIWEGAWNWPPITDMESIEITHSLPIIHGGSDRILWTSPGGPFLRLLPMPYFLARAQSRLVFTACGTFKIPRHRSILWLAILGRLSTLDKP